MSQEAIAQLYYRNKFEQIERRLDAIEQHPALSVPPLAAAPGEGTAAPQSAGSDASIAPERESSRMESPDSAAAAAPSAGELVRRLRAAQAGNDICSIELESSRNTLCEEAADFIEKHIEQSRPAAETIDALRAAYEAQKAEIALLRGKGNLAWPCDKCGHCFEVCDHEKESAERRVAELEAALKKIVNQNHAG